MQNNSYPFPIDEHTLKLATLQRVVVSPRRDFMRIRSMALRLAFHFVCQDYLSDQSSPIPSTLPSLGRHQFRQPSVEVWSAFAQRIQMPTSFQKQLTTLSIHEIAEYEKKGWSTLKQRSSFEHLRHLFRLPLEMWLILDRALALESKGYHTTIDRFCPLEVSPRHFRITATR